MPRCWITRVLCNLSCVLVFVWPALALAVTAQDSALTPDREIAAIINGADAVPGTTSWMAALIRRQPSYLAVTDRQFCGGSLVAPEWIVTAAHCVQGLGRDDFDVVLGSADLGGENVDLSAVAEIIVDPYFRYFPQLEDVAMIRLARPSTLAPVKLADAGVEAGFYDRTVTVYGWGATRWSGNADCVLYTIGTVENQDRFSCHTKIYQEGDEPGRLQQATLELATPQECGARFYEMQGKHKLYGLWRDEENPRQLCAWDRRDSTFPCHGDSGGPLIGVKNGESYLLGVVSFSLLDGCTTVDQIAFFMRVAAKQAFIQHTMARELRLSFDKLCPPVIAPSVSFEAAAGGRERATVSWVKSERADGYRLFYSANPVRAGFVGKLEFPASADSFTVELPPGSRYIISMQGTSSVCDGDRSPLMTVDVP